MSGQSEEECLAAFRGSDKLDAEQTLSLDDMEHLMQELGYNPTTDDLSKYDKENGRVNETDFLACVKDQPEDIPEDLKAAFSYYDTDNSGFIERKELGAILIGCPNTSQEDIDGLFDAADVNKDGLLNINEFVDILLTGAVTKSEPQNEETQNEAQ